MGIVYKANNMRSPCVPVLVSALTLMLVCWNASCEATPAGLRRCGDCIVRDYFGNGVLLSCNTTESDSLTTNVGILLREPVPMISATKCGVRRLFVGVFKNSLSADIIDLNQNQLTQLHRNTFSGLHNVTVLILNRNKLRYLGKDVFHKLRSLKRLFLHGNRIWKITKRAFSGLSNMEQLDLSNNKIRELPKDVFHNMKGLRSLDLSNNQLKSFPVGTFGNANLYSLGLSNNKIRELHKEMFHNIKGLRNLYLDNNKIRELHKDVFHNVEGLKTLMLSSNPVRELPEDVLHSMNSLTVLYLKKNQITTLKNVNFTGLTNLKELYLDHNRIRELPQGGFHSMCHLEHLYLEYNSLTSLPSGVFDRLYSLSSLRLSFNQLTTLPQGLFDDLPLASLYLEHDNLIQIPYTLRRYAKSSLSSIYLGYNNLSVIPPKLGSCDGALINPVTANHRLCIFYYESSNHFNVPYDTTYIREYLDNEINGTFCEESCTILTDQQLDCPAGYKCNGTVRDYTCTAKESFSCKGRNITLNIETVRAHDALSRCGPGQSLLTLEELESNAHCYRNAIENVIGKRHEEVWLMGNGSFLRYNLFTRKVVRSYAINSKPGPSRILYKGGNPSSSTPYAGPQESKPGPSRPGFIRFPYTPTATPRADGYICMGREGTPSDAHTTRLMRFQTQTLETGATQEPMPTTTAMPKEESPENPLPSGTGAAMMASQGAVGKSPASPISLRTVQPVAGPADSVQVPATKKTSQSAAQTVDTPQTPDVCSSNPCLHGGSCIPAIIQTNAGYLCLCEENYTGYNCQLSSNVDTTN
ncbi:uncharacterized protein LOC135809906 isoform X2 [Sycon ciliatum]|uniref:uncharacterized protein LOC135809906 isoform X2 n=1 Tax=Sycon ciliatum TaxID=27933 RepID=UPI0031F6CB50